MSIFPATDIVADVARAADPQRAQAAYARLAAIAGAREIAAAPAFSVGMSAPVHEAPKSSPVSPSSPARVETLSPAQKFEAFLLQSWLETLLPKEESSVFGADAGANVWRSMMAEQLGTTLAAAGGLGLQKLLQLQDHAPASERRG